VEHDGNTIGRWWTGTTSPENADPYEQLLRTKIFPTFHRIAGHRGSYLFRRPIADGVEFATLTLWDSMDAVRAFAGSEHAKAVIPPEAERLLRTYDRTAVHYSIKHQPDQSTHGG
jgi:heme-degrading monooxygenase HmoA